MDIRIVKNTNMINDLRPHLLLFKAIGIALPLSIASTNLAAAEPIRLNDTGVDWCGNNQAIKVDCPQSGHPGQDGETGRDALAKAGKLKKVGAGHAGFDFTKLDKQGQSLPADARQWSCVMDNHSGLMWEVKSTTKGLHSMENTYTWYKSIPKSEGMGVKGGGICSGSRCDTEGYVEAVNQSGLCGHGDWRLPRVEELRSIVHYGRSFPAIDIDYFPNTPSEAFWTSEPWVRRDGKDAHVIQFHGGRARYFRNDEAVRVRLVRDTP